MISNPNLVYYACIAHSSTILGEISKEPGLGALAQRCIDHAPPHHSLYSHTARKRTYTFSMAEPFICFAIFDQDLDQAEAVAFLNRVRSELAHLAHDCNNNNNKFARNCFQADFEVVMHSLMERELLPDTPPEGRNLSMDSSDSVKGKRMVLAPLLGQGLSKKKKRLSGDCNGEMCKDVMGLVDKNVGDGNACEDGRELQHKSGGGGGAGGVISGERQRAKQVWRKHVWVVLGLDVFVCAVLFGVWLWVCRGFKCIET